MAKSVVINNVTYSDVPYIEVPLSSENGFAEFYDTSDATLDSGNKMLSGNTAYANGTKYSGSIETQTAASLSASGDTVTVPAGYYASQATKAVSSGSAAAPSTISGTSATVSTGSNTITLSKSVSVTPVVSAGYVTAGTSTSSSVSLTASVTTKAAATITPGTSNQEIAAGTYLTGKQTIVGDADLISANIKSGVTIFNIAGSLTAATVSQDAQTKVLSIS